MPANEEKIVRRLTALHRKEEEENTKLLASQYQLPYLDPSRVSIEVDSLKLVPEERARDAEIAAIQSTGKHLKIALHTPNAEQTLGALDLLKKQGYTIELFFVSKSGLEYAWESYRKIAGAHELPASTIQISTQRLAAFQKELSTLKDTARRIEEALGARTTEVLEIILAGALALDASDVHIEPQKDFVRLRFRLDGLLHDVTTLPNRPYQLLLSRIKLISELKLNVRDRAQDGRFTVNVSAADAADPAAGAGVPIEVRTSVLPGPYGENAALRILNPTAIHVDFEELGMQPWVAETLKGELKKPNGMILTTGPTGAGKTTTLYTFLRTIHAPGIKIITIEDPIEYHVEGVEQTQADPENGYGFAQGLRSILRQDPDVILVGEIRDRETAETAMHAALTGHLVFSTLHTNNAAGTIPRLIDLDVKPAIIAPAINIAMAQRLVRKLCDSCKIPSTLPQEAKDAILKELAGFPEEVSAPNPKQWMIFERHENGCASCSGIGYKKRVGIFEIIIIDEPLERLILKEGTSEFDIQKEAVRQHQITMRQDGLLKVLAGITDFEELERAVGIEIR